MIKKLQDWQIVQKFLDIRSGIVLSLAVVNSLVMGWICLIRKQPFPEGYTTFLGILFTGITVGKVTKTMKGQDNE